MDAIYEKLARHLGRLSMGYPYNEALPELLAEMFTPDEAAVALAIPADLVPLEAVDADTIAQDSGLDPQQTAAVLQELAARRVIYSAPLPGGGTGYALLQVGYGMPQTFFWGGEQDDRARLMAKRVLKYFTVPTTEAVYGGSPTKAFKYLPAGLAVDMPRQGVLPQEEMAPIVQAADKIAVAHCPCRMSARLLGRTDCRHPLEVCLKYDEMAEFVLDKGLARPISADEAMALLEQCERDGLVHMVDNAADGIKHTCNCCGHYCWNVGIIARRKIPRDVLMAVYFIRHTDEDLCLGCEACFDICPVDVLHLNDDGVAEIDPDWCIGCGVCATVCPADAISIVRRIEEPSPPDFRTLHAQIASERPEP